MNLLLNSALKLGLIDKCNSRLLSLYQLSQCQSRLTYNNFSTSCYFTNSPALVRICGCSSNISNTNPRQPSVLIPRLRAPKNINYVQVRNAGHSKWANIKHTKSLKDAEKSREFAKYVQAIRVAAKENGSPDPKVNKKMADAIERAKSAKVPTATIQKAIDSVTKGFGKGGDYKMFTLPIKGPGNCNIICKIEAVTLSKAKQIIVPTLKRHMAIIAEDSLLRQFDFKGVVLCTGINGVPFKEDQLEACVEAAIEAGANDVQWTESPEFGQVMEFITEPDSFYQVNKNLGSLNYDIVYSEVDYIPLQFTELSEEQLEVVQNLFTKLSDSPDVVKLYDNIA